MSNPYPYTILGTGSKSPLESLPIDRTQALQALLLVACATYFVYPRIYIEIIERVDTMIWRVSGWLGATKIEEEESEETPMKVAPRIKRRAKVATGTISGAGELNDWQVLKKSPFPGHGQSLRNIVLHELCPAGEMDCSFKSDTRPCRLSLPF